MKKKIIAVISGAVILIIAAGSIYGKVHIYEYNYRKAYA